MTTQTATRTARPDYSANLRHCTLDGAEQVFEPCWKCLGSGLYPSSLWEGKCLACRGGKGVWTTKADYNRRAHNRALAAARRARKAEQDAATRDQRIAALHEALTAQAPLLAELTYLGNVDRGNGYGHNYWGKLGELRLKLEKYGSLSDKQIIWAEAMVRDGMDRQTRRDRIDAAHREMLASRVNAHIGAEGDRRVFTGTVRRTWVQWSDYGASTLIVLDTTEGTVTWWRSGEHEIEDGAELTVKATIKRHDVRNGECQTVVTRGKVQ